MFQVWTKRGLLITDPIERGLRVVEISILTEQANQQPNPPDWQVDHASKSLYVLPWALSGGFS
jgi:hypothetical protein